MSDVRITHIGGPTVLIAVAGWRLLTDPTFDPPGRRYTFGWGTASRKPSWTHAVAAAGLDDENGEWQQGREITDRRTGA